jgi:hypothetical protein
LGFLEGLVCPGFGESVHLTQLCGWLVVVDGFVFDGCVHSNG